MNNSYLICCPYIFEQPQFGQMMFKFDQDKGLWLIRAGSSPKLTAAILKQSSVGNFTIIHTNEF